MSMSHRPTLVGTQIDEYYLEAMLGEGGMASVYRAIDVRLNRYVAIKVIQTSFRDNEMYKTRFEREARAIAQLQHPNVITLYRFGDQEGLLYLAMQYVDGADLAAVIESFRQDNAYIEFAEVVRLAHEIGDALDYVHSHGVIHRDIKPHNIMISSDNRAIVTDFGLALMTELGTQGEIFGSPQYIAPEQAISSAGAVPQSDLYAFAVVLYQMLTNAIPFDAESPLDVAMMHMSDPVPSPREFRPELSEAVEEVLLKALAKTPADRYPTGKALADALENALLVQAESAPVAPHAPKSTSIAERVALELDENPLPPIPASVSSSTDPAIPETPITQVNPATAPPTVEPPAPPTRPHERASSAPTTPIINRRWLIYTGASLALLILFLIFVFLSNRSEEQDVLELIPSSAAVVENPTIIMTVVMTETSVALPTPTSLPLQTSPSELVVTSTVPAFQPTITPQTEVQNPPTQLSLLSGGRGLTTGRPVTGGEFEVEGYCLRLNGTYLVDEDGVNWYCTQNGQRVLTLTTEHFDEICQLTYNNPNAFAVQALGSEPAAYRWRCFENVADTSAAGNTNALSSRHPSAYNLTIMWRGEDSLFVTNTGTTAFPLSSLTLSGQGQVNGSEWNVSSLGSGECVAIWKDSGNPRAANDSCTQVGARVTRDGQNRFWKSSFTASYNGAQVTTCSMTPCTINIQP